MGMLYHPTLERYCDQIIQSKLNYGVLGRAKILGSTGANVHSIFLGKT